MLVFKIIYCYLEVFVFQRNDINTHTHTHSTVICLSLITLRLNLYLTDFIFIRVEFSHLIFLVLHKRSVWEFDLLFDKRLF